ncbi:hypothetical protein K461DRAFT_134468 [Myriangium duriaei CBS 260.36]|uniref:Uncharacterized protein n=1 Tax=Myriangium duriaei CBS 260.36 TaxID=1168546 RepID=A0A9P4J650_9PEZI|nr:hypothetical protein K461DRAFT_134468 [Myriangium duriaei CBS 260.36]
MVRALESGLSQGARVLNPMQGMAWVMWMDVRPMNLCKMQLSRHVQRDIGVSIVVESGLHNRDAEDGHDTCGIICSSIDDRVDGRQYAFEIVAAMRKRSLMLNISATASQMSIMRVGRVVGRGMSDRVIMMARMSGGPIIRQRDADPVIDR